MKTTIVVITITDNSNFEQNLVMIKTKLLEQALVDTRHLDFGCILSSLEDH